MKGLETLICLATKILKIGPKLRELKPWHSKYPEIFNADIISALITSLWLVTLMSGSGYFDCQGHNSLNFGPIFKILVAKHISVSRPFIHVIFRKPRATQVTCTSTWCTKSNSGQTKEQDKKFDHVAAHLHGRLALYPQDHGLYSGFYNKAWNLVSTRYLICTKISSWFVKTRGNFFSSIIYYLLMRYQLLIIFIPLWLDDIPSKIIYLLQWVV